MPPLFLPRPLCQLGLLHRLPGQRHCWLLLLQELLLLLQLLVLSQRALPVLLQGLLPLLPVLRLREQTVLLHPLQQQLLQVLQL